MAFDIKDGGRVLFYLIHRIFTAPEKHAAGRDHSAGAGFDEAGATE